MRVKEVEASTTSQSQGRRSRPVRLGEGRKKEREEGGREEGGGVACKAVLACWTSKVFMDDD